MPCFSLAVMKLALDANVASEILKTPNGLDPLVKLIEKTVTVYGRYTVTARANDKKTWADITITDANGREQAQLVIYTEAWALHSGRRMSDSLKVQGQNRTLVPIIAAAVQQFAEQYAKVLLRERMRAEVRRAFTVTREVRTPNGGIIQEVVL